MNAPFRLYGAEFSPYSIKVRSYLRYKGVEFDWRERTAARQEEFARYAKQPLAPVLVDADDSAMQDSTRMIEALERRFSEPAIAPEDPALGFIAALLEDYADEWLNKAMFHYRWTYPQDQDSAAKRIIATLFENAEAPVGVEEAIKTRMSGRLHHIGSSPDNSAVLEASFIRLAEKIERLLASRPYLLGARPSLADFGLAGQFTQLLSDPTPGALLKGRAPNLVHWVDRMENPASEGAFAPWDVLRADLADLLRGEIAPTYLVWAAANAQAVADGAPGVSVTLAGGGFTQKPQRYAAKAFAELCRKRAELADREALAALLGETGCDAFLAAPEASEDDADNFADGEDEEG